MIQKYQKWETNSTKTKIIFEIYIIKNIFFIWKMEKKKKKKKKRNLFLIGENEKKKKENMGSLIFCG